MVSCSELCGISDEGSVKMTSGHRWGDKRKIWADIDAPGWFAEKCELCGQTRLIVIQTDGSMINYFGDDLVSCEKQRMERALE